MHSLTPDGIHVSLAGDSEFGSMDLCCQLDAWGWDYALRQKGTKRFMPKGIFTLYRLDHQNLQPGDVRWLGGVNLTASNPYITNLVLYWKRGEPDPWYLAISLPSAQGAIML